jgi:8-amino-7-oxononanoate synthase
VTGLSHAVGPDHAGAVAGRVRADRGNWDDRVTAELDAVRSAGRWRQPRDLATTGPVTGRVGDDAGRPVVSFASNDYLGLTHHPAVVAAAHEALDRWGAGTGASRLVVGSRPLHGELERELADWKGTEDAVLFPTGYAANLGLLATFGGAGVTLLSDELNHASIVDGCRLARAAVRIHRHLDLDHLDELLAEVGGPALVVTDSAFSMDGDVADLDGLVDRCRAHGALLVLDEAHAVLGPAVPAPSVASGLGGGLALLRMGTLSKALGSLGGFVAGPRPYVDLLRNRARPFIFTTAPPPAAVAAALAAVRVVRSPEGAALTARLRGHVERLRPGHQTPIVPIVLGDEGTALAAAADLLDRGLLVPAIRPPTVPPGTSRLRVAVSAAHGDDQVDQLLDALADLALADIGLADIGLADIGLADIGLGEGGLGEGGPGRRCGPEAGPPGGAHAP